MSSFHEPLCCVRKVLASPRLAFGALVLVAHSVAFSQPLPPPGVGIYLSNAVTGTFGGVGNGDASYATGPGVSIYNGGGLQVFPAPYYAVTSPQPMPLGLTAGTLSSVGSSGPTAGNYAEVVASADLRGGVLRASVVGGNSLGLPPNPVGPNEGRGLATAFMQDHLTFQVASGGTADITVTAHLDGFFTVTDPVYGFAGQTMSLNIGGAHFTELGGQLNNGGGTYHGHNGASGFGPPYGWVSYSFSNETPTGFDFTGILAVSDGERTTFNLGLDLDCAGGSCGFTRTGTVGLVLPQNVTFTSDSGVFLAGNGVTPVPEPETWALMLAGLGLLGNFARRRQRRLDPL